MQQGIFLVQMANITTVAGAIRMLGSSYKDLTKKGKVCHKKSLYLSVIVSTEL